MLVDRSASNARGASGSLHKFPTRENVISRGVLGICGGVLGICGWRVGNLFPCNTPPELTLFMYICMLTYTYICINAYMYTYTYTYMPVGRGAANARAASNSILHFPCNTPIDVSSMNS